LSQNGKVIFLEPNLIYMPMKNLILYITFALFIYNPKQVRFFPVVFYLFPFFFLIFSSQVTSAQDESIKTLTGHTSEVASVSFGPDVKYLASSSGDKTIKIWDVEKGTCIKTLEGHTSFVRSVSFSPDGKYLASGSLDKTIKIWDVEKGTCIETLKGHTDWVNSVSYRPDGKYLASGTSYEIKIWDVEKGTCIKTLRGHISEVSSISFSLDGKYLASSFNKKINIWDVGNGTCIKTLKRHTSYVWSVSFNPDGKYLASGSGDKTIKIWDVEKGTCIKTLTGHTDGVSSISFSPDGKYLASSSGDKTIKIWDVEKENCIKTLSGHTKSVWSVSFSPDGKYLASSSVDKTIKIWEVWDKKEQIQNYVNEKISQWQQKGKYESIDEYKTRLNEKARQEQIAIYTQEILKILAEKQNILKIKSTEYDTDNQVFKLVFDKIESIYIKVPKTEAPSFDNNLSKLKYENPEFIFTEDEKFVLLSMEIVNPANNKKYVYDSKNPITFKTTSIVYNFAPAKFEPVKIDLKDNLELPKVQETATDTIWVGKSDVDINIPQAKATIKKENCYALIIGNEDYSSYQRDLTKEQNVAFAINDAKVFSEYIIKTFGVPEKQVFLLTNATGSQIYQGLEKLNQLAKNEEGNAELIFYYAGHGLPDQTNKEPYLIPVDVSAGNLQYAIKLNDVFKKLTESPSKKVTVFLDACFSGGARNQSLVAVRGVKIKPREDILQGNIVVISSSSGDEQSGSYKDKQHGLFTYFLLKKIQQTQGNVTYKELSDYIIDNVKKESILINGQIQTPKISASEQINELWTEWMIK